MDTRIRTRIHTRRLFLCKVFSLLLGVLDYLGFSEFEIRPSFEAAFVGVSVDSFPVYVWDLDKDQDMLLGIFCYAMKERRFSEIVNRAIFEMALYEMF